MLSYEALGRQIGQLVDEKNRAYGDAFGKTAQILAIIFPDGVSVEQYRYVGLIVRVLDKLCRVANDTGAFEENPFADLAGYGLLAMNQWNEQQVENGRRIGG